MIWLEKNIKLIYSDSSQAHQPGSIILPNLKKKYPAENLLI